MGGVAIPDEEPGGATRYALPCRPVKPLLIMECVGHMWARQREHRSRDCELAKKLAVMESVLGVELAAPGV